MVTNHQLEKARLSGGNLMKWKDSYQDDGLEEEKEEEMYEQDEYPPFEQSGRDGNAEPFSIMGRYGFYIVAGAAIVILVILFSLLRSGPSGSQLEQQLIVIEEKLGQLEARMQFLEAERPSLDQYKHLGKGIEMLSRRTVRMEETFAERFVQIEDALTALNKKTATSVKKSPAPAPAELPPQKKARFTKKRSSAAYHEVKAGDTLYGISRKYGVTIEDLIRWNNLSSKAVLQPGQKIKIGS
jgi:LysM repeat protein